MSDLIRVRIENGVMVVQEIIKGADDELPEGVSVTHDPETGDMLVRGTVIFCGDPTGFFTVANSGDAAAILSRAKQLEAGE